MMNQILWWQRCLNSRIAHCFVLGMLLAATQMATAETQPFSMSSSPPDKAEANTEEYQPPADQLPPSGSTSTTGTRGGCDSIEGASLTILAPLQHVGRTVSAYPTLAWFVPDTKPFPVELKLYKYGSRGKFNPVLIQTHQLKSSPGIMQFSLSKDKPGLNIGQRYLWQVAIICNPDYPSGDKVAMAEMEVVEMPPAVKAQVASTGDRSEAVALYAKAGLWYDALGEALKPASNGKPSKTVARLLENLAQIETPERSQNLSRIANSAL